MSDPNKITWTPGRKPWCTRCSTTVRVYMVFVGDGPKGLGTWCPKCDPYASKEEHWESWKPAIAGDLKGECLKVPLDDTAWEYARKFMQGEGERSTRESPGM